MALSSAESELLAMSLCASEAKLIFNTLQEIGSPVHHIQLVSDSTAAVAMTRRRGVGKVRHRELKYFCLQEEDRTGKISSEHIDGKSSVADLFTKQFASRKIS